MAQLGRISGPLLNANLERNGIDLQFKNTVFDTALLFLDVNNNRIGVNTDTPQFDLDINSDFKSTDVVASGSVRIDNLIFNGITSTLSSVVGPVNLTPYTSGGERIEFGRLRTDDLEFNDNYISSLETNTPIIVEASGTGTIEVSSTTNITGDASVTGNVTVDGNLTNYSRIIIGDELYNPDTLVGDTVDIVPDFTQSIIPGDDNTYNLGRQQNDSSPRRWAELHTPDLTKVGTNLPNSVKVSDQTYLDGVNNEIFGLQSDEDIVLAPDSGIVEIESTRWNEVTASSTNSSINGYTLTIAGTITGSFVPGTRISGVGIAAGTVITGTSTGSDSTGTYTVNINYDGNGSNPSAVSGIGITGTVDNITNLSFVGGQQRITTPLSFASTGIGYLRFMGDNAFVIPAGDTAARPNSPELGDTRWNTDEQYLECFDGSVYAIATGGGAEIDVDKMEDLGNIYSLMLA